jgi:hypothetical protein
MKHSARRSHMLSAPRGGLRGRGWRLLVVVAFCAVVTGATLSVPASITARMLAGSTPARTTRVAAAAADSSNSPSSNASCSGLYFVSARGSGEPYKGATNMSVSGETDTVLKGIVDELRAAHLTIPIQEYQLGPAYTAPSVKDLLSNLSIQTTIPGIWHQFADVNVPNYIGQEEAGEAELYGYLTGIYYDCYPTGHEPMVVLAGYSQGAMVVHNLLNTLAANDQTGYMSMIKGAVLIADPERMPFSDVLNFGTAPSNDYGACHLADNLDLHKCVPPNATTDVAKYFASVTTAICDQGDVVCDTSSLLSLKDASSLSSLRAAISVGEWVHTNCHVYCGSFGPVITAGRGIGLNLVDDVRGATPSPSPSPTPTPTSTVPSSWTATEVPLPGNAGSSEVTLTGEACPSSSQCIAVGYYIDSSGYGQGLLLSGYGTSWTATEAPPPPGATGDGGLTGVACYSPTRCVALGEYTSSSGYAQGWQLSGSGTSWTSVIAPLPYPADQGASLDSVACPSADECVVAGDLQVSASDVQGLLLSGYGTSWTSTQAPLPANADPADPEDMSDPYPAVACASPSYCVAVGSYDDSSGDRDGVLLSGSGTSWTAAEAPLPANATASASSALVPDLSSVACPSTAGCVVVGTYDSQTAKQGVVLSGYGSSWTSAEAPLPAGTPSENPAMLASVACTSAASCVAGGLYTNSSGNWVPLLLSGAGTSWTATTAPLPSATSTLAQPQGLSSVACPSASQCVAVGAAQEQTGSYGLLLTGSGTSWTPALAPLPADASSSDTAYLYSVACNSPTMCLAIGEYPDASGTEHGLLLTGPN